MANTAEDLDFYTFDNDKHMFSSKSGKGRSKREVAGHTNRFDPNGHSRKITSKIRNTEKNSTAAAAKNGPVTKKAEGKRPEGLEADSRVPVTAF